MTEGRFITFEGGEGSGKTTQMRLLAERMRAQGREVVETVEPGGTAIGDQIRAVLLDRRNRELCAISEMLLYFAARAQNLHQVIRPALARGAVVLADRYTDSTLAYQGIARGLGAPLVLQLHDAACAGMWPELTLYLDIDPRQGLARRHATEEVNRLDAESLQFHQAVRAAYLDLAAQHPDRIVVIPATASPQLVAEQVWEAVAPHV